MTLFKILIDNRSYTSWSIIDEHVREDINIDPLKHHLFSGDTFSFNTENNIDIIHSSVRNVDNIPGVLILENNKTYGKTSDNKKTSDNNKKTSAKKTGKLLYRCIPDDIRLPIFLVPYEIKQMGFSKVFINLYVTIRFSSWTDTYPHATLTQTIGPINILNNYYEYQLYCKSLNSSMQRFNKDAKTIIDSSFDTNNTFIESICGQIERRTIDWRIFSIDPANSMDLDDAFSIKRVGTDTIMLSIYIANVTIWMDALNLWSSFSQRISTIYLPDRKRPMLPTILSDCLCSLQANASRLAFVMDLIIDESTSSIVSIKYSNCLISVYKNYIYEEPSLLVNPDYLLLLDISKKMSKMYKYISNIKNSHDVVAYLMILMNYNCAKELVQSKSGIFRSTTLRSDSIVDPSLNEEVSKYIKIWNNSCGHYVVMNEESDPNIIIKHDLLEMDAYIHITSPIRRLVDLLNIIKFQQIHGLFTLSEKASEFYLKWIQQIDYINVTMRAIKKIQNDCTLLDTCFNNPGNLDKFYDGYCFDKLVREDGLFQYIVYLPELKLTSRITTHENMENYEKRQYKLFMFNNEEKFKKKIRLQIQTI